MAPAAQRAGERDAFLGDVDHVVFRVLDGLATTKSVLAARLAAAIAATLDAGLTTASAVKMCDNAGGGATALICNMATAGSTDSRQPGTPAMHAGQSELRQLLHGDLDGTGQIAHPTGRRGLRAQPPVRPPAKIDDTTAVAAGVRRIPMPSL